MNTQRRISLDRATRLASGARLEEEVSFMHATLESTRLKVAVALCALLTALVGTSIVPTLAGNDGLGRLPIPGMPTGGCPPRC